MENIITLNKVTKDFGHQRGIFDFALNIKKGQVHGLVGSNGSGKSTTMRLIMGFLKPTQGVITVHGLNAWTQSSDIKKYIGYVPGEIDFPDVGTGSAFLKLQADFLGIKDLTYMNKLISLFQLDCDVDLKRMSKGMKQKTALVVAFMGDPELLILDEPSTGLDPLMRDTLIQLILNHRQRGATIFISSHIFKELQDTCDCVTFIHNGRFTGFVEQAMYNDDQNKLFKVGFQNIKDFEAFNLSLFDQKESKVKHFEHTFSVSNKKINQLFKELTKYQVRFITQIPYTLEYYYNEVIMKVED